MDVAVECYALTRAFPVDERYGLRRELRRSAVSIPSNIAEGDNRRGRRAYLNHVNIALGSQAELESQLELAVRLGFLANGGVRLFQERLARVGQMLHGLQKSLEAGRTRSAIVGALAFLLSAAGTLLWAR
jgi:four helix bundle protein